MLNNSSDFKHLKHVRFRDHNTRITCIEKLSDKADHTINKMKINDDFMLQNVGGQYIIVPLGAKVMDLNGLIVLNDTGAHLWHLVSENIPREDMVRSLAEDFEVSQEQAGEDIDAFFAQLGELGILDA